MSSSPALRVTESDIQFLSDGWRALAAAREPAIPWLEAGLYVMVMRLWALSSEAFAPRLRETARRVGRRPARGRRDPS